MIPDNRQVEHHVLAAWCEGKASTQKLNLSLELIHSPGIVMCVDVGLVYVAGGTCGWFGGAGCLLVYQCELLISL